MAQINTANTPKAKIITGTAFALAGGMHGDRTQQERLGPRAHANRPEPDRAGQDSIQIPGNAA